MDPLGREGDLSSIYTFSVFDSQNHQTTKKLRITIYIHISWYNQTSVLSVENVKYVDANLLSNTYILGNN